MSEPERTPDYSFLDDEPTSPNQDLGERNEFQAQTPPFEPDVESKDSYASALDEEEVSSISTPLRDFGGGVDGVVSCMSTIEEESRTYETSTAPSFSVSRSHNPVVQEQDLLASNKDVRDDSKNPLIRNIDQELEELRRFVDRTAAETENSPRSPDSTCLPPSSFDRQAPSASSAVNQPKSKVDDNKNISTTSDHDLGELLLKLQKLESTQDILEQILNTGTPDQLDFNAIINQLDLPLPLDDPNTSVRGIGDNEDPKSERSVSSEIASIQKLLDFTDLSVSINLNSSQVAGGNNNFDNPALLQRPENNDNIQESSSKKERDIDDVLKEYEEFERSLSQVSGVDESFRSEIASIQSFSADSGKAKASPSVPEKETIPSSFTTVPVIKPPVLKSVVPPPSLQPEEMPPAPPPLIKSSSPSRKSPYSSPSHLGSARTRPKPVTTSVSTNKKKSESHSKTSRIEGSQSSHGIKTQQPTSHSHSARQTASSTTASSRDNTQEAYKPRNRRFPSPRTVHSSSHPQQLPFSSVDMPKKSSIGGSGEGYHTKQHQPQSMIEDTNNVIATEALKTIEKLNAMVARQETLLEAYSNDNDRLWTQLREAKDASNTKEVEFQDVINSLKTEVATLKLNRLMTSPRQRPAPVNRDEVERLRQDSELKSQQVLELRKEILLLQSKLSGKSKSPEKSGQGTASSLVAQEKEKEYHKQITALNKQVRTLQKILYSKDQTAPVPTQPSTNTSRSQSQSRSRPLQRARSSNDGFKSGSGTGLQQQQQQALIRSVVNTGVDSSGIFGKRPGSSPSKSVNINTGDILQASLNCIEQEREEFENVIAEKNKIIFEKERMILNLKGEIETLKRELPEEGDVVEPGLIDELRSRIITQNKVIQQLKEHLSTFKKIETENLVLREEKRVLENKMMELRRKLEFAQNLGKPENEVLCLLSEKVDELNSRYFHRERQLDSLLNRLTVSTTAVSGEGLGVGVGGSSSTSGSSSSPNSNGVVLSRPLLLTQSSSSPRRGIAALDQFNNNNGSLGKTRCGASSTAIIPVEDILHMADFSPSASFQYGMPEM